MSQDKKATPVKKFRLGDCEVAIWMKQTEYGPMFNSTFRRSYKNGDEWMNTDTFRPVDLPIIGSLAQSATIWIQAARDHAKRNANERQHEEDFGPDQEGGNAAGGNARGNSGPPVGKPAKPADGYTPFDDATAPPF